MQLTSTDTQEIDLALADRAAAGDREAFAALYERYVQGIFDFVLRIVRDEDATADVVQVTFVKAWQSLGGRKRPKNVKAWLYATAHNAAIDELRRTKRLVRLEDDERPDVSGNPLAQIDTSRLSDPEAVARDRGLVELVWQCAAALSPKEYALLDMNVRQGLDADELSDALGVRKGAIYTMLSRLRGSLEESVTSSLLMQRGRRDCAELDALLTQLNATEFTKDVRQAVQRHLKDCARCQESKRRYVSPIEIFAGIAPVPVLPAVQGAIWNNVSSHVVSGATASGSTTAAAGQTALGQLAQLPGQWWAGASLAAKAIVAGATTAAVAGIVAGAFVVMGGGGDVSVHDPSDVHSVSHEVGVASDDNIIRISWSEQSDVQGYSVRWSTEAGALPDETVDLPGDATATISPPLPPGDWYFTLRTENTTSDWTSTVHLGPFSITALVVAPPQPSDEPPPPTNDPPTLVATPTPQRSSAVAGAVVTPLPTATTTPTPTSPLLLTPTPGPTATRTPTSRPAATSTPTPRPAATATLTNTPRPLATSTPTDTPTPTFQGKPGFTPRPITPIEIPAKRPQS